MARKSFTYNGIKITKAGWKYYQSEDGNVKLKIKGLKVVKWQ